MITVPARIARFAQILWVPLGALALAWALSLTPLYQRLDVLTLDTQTRLVAQNHYFKDALVIDIDDHSLQEMQAYFGGWPYKRDIYAMLLDYLNEMGARTVAFDVVFADPREGDKRLSDAIARAGNVVLSATARSAVEEGERPVALDGLAWIVPEGLPAQAWPAVQLPLQEFTRPAKASAHIGVVSVIADSDGMLRRLPLFYRFNGQYLPGLPVAAYFSAGPQPRVQINPDGTTQVGPFTWPADEEGAVRLYYPRNKNSVLTIPFARVARAMLGMQGQALDPNLFRGKTVFVGSTAFYSDSVQTPVGNMSGVDILAIAYESLGQHLILAPSDWRWTGMLLLIALLPSLLLFWQPRRRVRAGTKYSLAAAGIIYCSHLALLYWFKQESALLLPLLVVLIANLLELMRAIHIRNEEQKAEIHVLANDDPLTRLPNRFSMQMQLAHAIEHARIRHGSLAVLLIGLNELNAINTALGHETGDQLLIEVADRLRSSMPSNIILARLGGGEFVLCSADASSALQDADTILAAIAKPYHLARQELRVSANVGISLYPDDGNDAATLVRQADSAMRNAKAQGRNTRSSFTPDIGQAAVDRLLLENQLHQALDRNELVLFYQPQIDMQSGRMIAVEALVRWNHPVHGLLGPDHFIPLAEKSELILPLGEWVVRTACQQMHAWHLAGLTHIKRVAVNLSALQFEQAALPTFVASILKETQLDAGHLELEITESVAMEKPERTIKILNTLLDMGIRLALDDFGTGYSSMTYLKQLPITTLKIDASFVRNIETDRYDAEICTATISLARKLGLNVVAEGVETPGQFRFLRKIECHEAQGFLISHPLPAAELAQFHPPPNPD